MSRHWIPDRDSTRWMQAGYAPPADASPPVKKSWPKGATAGLMLVAAGCLGVGLLLYKAAERGYEIEKSTAQDWNSVDRSSPRR